MNIVRELQEIYGNGVAQGKVNPYGVQGAVGDFPGGAVVMDSSMMSAALAGPTMDLNEDSLDAPPSVSSTEAGPVMGTPSTPGTPAPSGKDKKVSVFSNLILRKYNTIDFLKVKKPYTL